MKILTSLFKLLPVFIGLLSLGGCIREEEFDNSPQGNFDALWTIIDEQYCFLDYKQIDWNAIYNQYRPLITPDMSNDGLFEVLGNMLAELKDGHVNLFSASNTARYWNWYLDYPRNFNESVVEGYLGRDYRIGGGAEYTLLDDNIGYIYYGDFSSGIGDGNLDEMLSYLSICNGLIIDVRNNGGGNLTYATKLAARFTNEKVLTGYIQHKTGKGHSDFSDPEPIYLEPSNSIRWQKGGGCPDEPPFLQRHQRLHQLHALPAERHPDGRQKRRRLGTAFLIGAAQRLGRAFLRQPAPGCRGTAHRVWHRPRRQAGHGR